MYKVRRFFCDKIYYKVDNKVKSFWHDIPLKSGDFYNMVIEIPAKNRTIREMTTKEMNNPILVKKPKPLTIQTEYPIRIRDYSRDPVMNYGYFPQTYSSKEKIYRELYKGDGDPLDVIEIGGPTNYNPGDVIQVKLLGSFCLIDQGEIDWKIIVSNVLNKETVPEEKIIKVMRWFKIFKSFYGKKENTILDNNKYHNEQDSEKVIEECNNDYFDYKRNLIL